MIFFINVLYLAILIRFIIFMQPKELSIYYNCRKVIFFFRIKIDRISKLIMQCSLHKNRFPLRDQYFSVEWKKCLNKRMNLVGLFILRNEDRDIQKICRLFLQDNGLFLVGRLRYRYSFFITLVILSRCQVVIFKELCILFWIKLLLSLALSL